MTRSALEATTQPTMMIGTVSSTLSLVTQWCSAQRDEAFRVWELGDSFFVKILVHPSVRFTGVCRCSRAGKGKQSGGAAPAVRRVSCTGRCPIVTLAVGFNRFLPRTHVCDCGVSITDGFIGPSSWSCEFNEKRKNVNCLPARLDLKARRLAKQG